VEFLGGVVMSCRRDIASLDGLIGQGILSAADAPWSAMQAESSIEAARHALALASENCNLLAWGLVNAAREYDFADRFANRLSQDLAARLAFALGSVAPLLLALLLPGAIAIGGVWLGAFALLPDSARRSALANLRSWFRRHAGPLSDPGFVQAVRMSAMSADDAGWGLLRVPRELAGLFGDEGLGIFGVDTSAAALAAAASGVGLLKESAVAVVAEPSTVSNSNAEGIRDRIGRIPEESEQVRIDRYSSPGLPDRFEVYIAGTAELGMAADADPWDMTSNVTAMSGGSSGSYRAVVEAMRLAGIDSNSAVTFTGYSQGGLIAAQLAASGDYAVNGLLTVGAPAGNVSVPHDIPYLAIEHTNDLVPALGGTFTSSEPVVVRRQLFDGPVPTEDFILPAHQLSNYRETAELVDSSTIATIETVRARFDHPHYSMVTSTLYRAERTAP
jgi:hypothetical protein